MRVWDIIVSIDPIVRFDGIGQRVGGMVSKTPIKNIFGGIGIDVIQGNIQSQNGLRNFMIGSNQRVNSAQ